MPTSDCRPTGDNPAQRFRPPPLRFGGTKTEKFSKHFFNRAPAKIFSIKEKKIFLFCLPLNRGKAETLSHPQSRFAGQQAGKNSFPPGPLFFLLACLSFIQFFGGVILYPKSYQLFTDDSTYSSTSKSIGGTNP